MSPPVLEISLLLAACLSCTFGATVTNATDCGFLEQDTINTTNVTELTELFQMCLDDAMQYDSCPDPTACLDTTQPTSENIGLAFGLTIGAGFATGIGALLPFIPCIKLSDTKYLTAGLGLATGVMLYISFTKVFNEARIYFCCVSTKHYDLLIASSFFIGILLTVLLDALVHGLERIHCGGGCGVYRSCRRSACGFIVCRNSLRRRNSADMACANAYLGRNTSQVSLLSMSSNGELVNGNGHTFPREGGEGAPTAHAGAPSLESSSNNSPNLPSVVDFSIPDNDRHMHEQASISAASNAVSTTTNNLGDASIQDLLSNISIHRMHAVVADSLSNMEGISQSHVSTSLMEDGFSLRTHQSMPNGDAHSRISAPSMQRRASDEDLQEETQEREEEEEGMENFRRVTDVVQSGSKRLRRMGLLTGLAIAIHNFPEGFATFVGTLSDPSLGIALAIAITIHNIPEGVCVAMPVYYSTGSRVKAFFWAFLSGISEPIGALIGWLTFKELFGPLFYAIAFGIISGMMVYVGLKELLPMAHKFDTTNGILTNVFLLLGMIIMAISLVMFNY